MYFFFFNFFLFTLVLGKCLVLLPRSVFLHAYRGFHVRLTAGEAFAFMNVIDLEGSVRIVESILA